MCRRDGPPYRPAKLMSLVSEVIDTNTGLPKGAPISVNRTSPSEEVINVSVEAVHIGATTLIIKGYDGLDGTGTVICDATAEVEAVDYIGGDWDPNFVRVGHVLAVEPHPNADRLRLATIDAGGSPQTVVCGAPNPAVGQNIAFATAGATLFDGHTGEAAVLKKNKIRGVESAGMVLSERELGLSENHDGILVLPDDAPIGRPLVEQIGDVIFDITTWANRADLLGGQVVGLEPAVTPQAVQVRRCQTWPQRGRPHPATSPGLLGGQPERPLERPGEPLVSVEPELDGEVDDPPVGAQHLVGGEGHPPPHQVVVRRVPGVPAEHPAEVIQ